MTTTRNQLLELDPAVLADTLLELAGHSDEAAELLTRLVATADEKVGRFKDRLAELHHSGNFYDWIGFMPHEQYKRKLRNVHGRKYSFWGKYDG